MNKQSLIKIFVTILLFSLAILKLNISEMLEMLEKSNLVLITISLVFIPILYWIRVLKWNALLRSVGIEYNSSTVFRVLLIGMFYGLITPGKSGEVIRAYYLDAEKSKTIPTIIWDKLIDIFILILLSVFSIFFLFYDTILYYIAILLIAIFISIIAILFNKKLIYYFFNLININEKSSKQFIETIHIIKNDKVLLLKLIILSIGYYSLNLIISLILLVALKSDANPYAIFILPIIVLIGNIPLTISGLGLREYIAVICFGILGESAVIGFSFSIILFLFTTLIPGLIGYIFILRKQNK
ncbi:MAG: lysylphosphatidylglycerol synthase transmembrane domain-containing protein [Candidatus Methanoperedens sp.]|nr:lysylphosphatidylglycerol synthase transmembrane domain-containing protein [Candidatus Methanoperedens sp.]